jgi:hypothetical protein
MSFDKFKSLMSNRMLFFAKTSVLSDKFGGWTLIPGLENECIKKVILYLYVFGLQIILGMNLHCLCGDLTLNTKII